MIRILHDLAGITWIGIGIGIASGCVGYGLGTESDNILQEEVGQARHAGRGRKPG